MSNTSFNELDDAQAERLAILAEECAEVIQIVGKILRHGYESTHPDNEDGPNNRGMLETELGHVRAAEKMLAGEYDIYLDSVRASCRSKLKRTKKYFHHQPGT